MSLYQQQSLPVRSEIALSHDQAIDAYADPGTWLDASTRIKILTELRASSGCRLCQARAAALSPYAPQAALRDEHDTSTGLDARLVEVVHRIASDSGRLTQRWYAEIIDQGITPEVYIETVGLVATGIIIDSFSSALGEPMASPPTAQMGVPSQIKNPKVVADGAWVPLLEVDQQDTPLLLPTSPNIFRAMGLVPGAIAHFFSVMRSQYSLTAYDTSLLRPQIELLASRVSSHNQCFY